MIGVAAVGVLVATAAADTPAAPPPEPAPAIELLEFIGDWSAEEGRLIDGDAAQGGMRANETKNDAEPSRSPPEGTPH